MPIWPGSDTPALERAAFAHTSEVGKAPLATAAAPATWSLLGEHVDHVGGVVLMSLSTQRVGVALSFRGDDTVHVQHHHRSARGEQLTDADAVSLSEVAKRATQQQPGVDESGKLMAPPVPTGGLAARLGGILWTMIHRQLLSRDTPGCDVTIVNDIPGEAGLGALASTDTAFALALHHTTGEADDAPARTRLAEVCSQSAAIFSRYPTLRARHTAALRGAASTVSVIDYADGSVTQAPHPVTRETRAFAVFAPEPAQRQDFTEEIRARQSFISRAERTFGVDSIRLLPDAPERVAEWLAAVHSVHGPEGVPGLSEARTWLSFYAAETQRAQQLASVLRSRRHGDAWLLLKTSQTALSHSYGLHGVDSALAKLCLERGALAARSAAAGTSTAVIVVVPDDKETNFVADLSADGLQIVPLETGEPAGTEQ